LAIPQVIKKNHLDPRFEKPEMLRRIQKDRFQIFNLETGQIF